MNFIQIIKLHYNIATNNGTENQLLIIGFIIGLLPFFALSENKYKSIRFLGALISIPWAVLFIPIVAPIIILGFIQFMWQSI